MSALENLTPLASLAPTAMGSGPGAVLRLRRWMQHAFGSSAGALQLPFAGLPAGVGSVPASGAALVLCGDVGSRERLLQALLLSTDRPPRMTWVCDPDRRFTTIGTLVQQAVADGTLRALTWSPESTDQLRRKGPACLVRELAFVMDTPRDLLVVDLFDPWLASLSDDAAAEQAIQEALECLHKWSRERRGPVLALAPANFRGQSLLPLVGNSRLSRISVLRQDGGGLWLDVLRWSRATQAQPDALRAYALDGPHSGPWTCRTSQPLPATSSLAPSDRQVVHATRGVLHDTAVVPAGWVIHTDLSALMVAARDAVAATVVLVHDHPDAIEPLADAVHRLRRAHPQMLRIVVREAGVPMRRNAALALRRLGANLIVERSRGLTDLLACVEQLRSEAHVISPVADPQQALSRLAPEAVHGYLPQREFCAAVERMLERTAGTPMEHSLVQLPLLPHVAHIDALQACSARRHGDIVTADRSSLFLFLFGCPAHSAVAALESMFAIPCSELAQHIEIHPDAESHHDAIAALRRSADEAPTDFSVFLRGSAVLRRAPAVQPAVLPVHSDAAGRTVQAHVLPLRATAQ